MPDLSLDAIALEENTDKASRAPDRPAHAYTALYERLLGSRRETAFRLLEIGTYTGASARLWRRYFPKAQIVSIDLDVSIAQAPGVILRNVDQTDAPALEALSAECGPFDVIIDDGSHINGHVRASFDALFPLLAPGGVYIIEDLHAFYHPAWGGAANASPFLDFVKTLIDEITWRGATMCGNPAVDRHLCPTELGRSLASFELHKSLLALHKSPLSSIVLPSPRPLAPSPPPPPPPPPPQPLATSYLEMSALARGGHRHLFLAPCTPTTDRLRFLHENGLWQPSGQEQGHEKLSRLV